VLGVRRYQAPVVLEGGAFFVDGEGTALTTEGPLLDPLRNPGATKAHLERVLHDYVGADQVIWLVAAPDRDTDGHVDGIAQYARPGAILLLVPDDERDENFEPARENLRRLADVTDARGRRLEVMALGTTGRGKAGKDLVELPYANFYLANGAVIVPVGGTPSDEAALARLAEVFPGREIAAVPGAVLSYGGGGPHCITQQMPVGVPAAP
jgi:agmatine deiminase